MVQPKNFGYNEDEKALKDVARNFFRDKFPVEKLHALVAAESDPLRAPECCWDRALWSEIRELGWLMTAVPERVGGLGMSAVAVTGLVEEAGRAAVTLAYEARRESDGEVCATGSTRLACVGRDGRLRRLPAELKA